MLRFLAADSMLAWSCKLIVIDSQLVRFTRIITEQQNFQDEVGCLLVDKLREGHPQMQLYRRCQHCWHIMPVLFGVAARGSQPSRGGWPATQGLCTAICASVAAALPHIHLPTPDSLLPKQATPLLLSQTQMACSCYRTTTLDLHCTHQDPQSQGTCWYHRQ